MKLSLLLGYLGIYGARAKLLPCVTFELKIVSRPSSARFNVFDPFAKAERESLRLSFPPPLLNKRSSTDDSNRLAKSSD